MSHGGSSINKTFILQAQQGGNFPTLSACTALYTNSIQSCYSGDTEIDLSQTGQTIFNNDIVPKKDGESKVGHKRRRFREINTISGKSTLWTSTTINSHTVRTKNLDLGYDSTANEQRVIDKFNSVIKNDQIYGGTY